MKSIKLGLVSLVGAVFCLAAACPSFAADGLTAGAPQSPSSAIWLGFGFKSHVYAGYGGGVWAPNGSLDSDGFQLRGELLYVDYHFNTTLSPTGTASGQLDRANAQVGYQIVRSGIASSLFVGPDYQDFSVSPGSASNSRLSDKVGLIATGRVANIGTPRIPFSVEGNYSTANDTYWAKAKTGMNFGQIAAGPEIAILGNVAFDEARYGMYTSIEVWHGKSVEIDAGYAQRLRGTSGVLGSSPASLYGDVTLVLLNY